MVFRGAPPRDVPEDQRRKRDSTACAEFLRALVAAAMMTHGTAGAVAVLQLAGVLRRGSQLQSLLQEDRGSLATFISNGMNAGPFYGGASDLDRAIQVNAHCSSCGCSSPERVPHEGACLKTSVNGRQAEPLLGYSFGRKDLAAWALTQEISSLNNRAPNNSALAWIGDSILSTCIARYYLVPLLPSGDPIDQLDQVAQIPQVLQRARNTIEDNAYLASIVLRLGLQRYLRCAHFLRFLGTAALE